ncbi:hypothetical protein [Vagococcus bubulae]|uniref:Uncharacterized protein n=1 Tax=Vagococcus bubulae TaxID=1977868 RepID=A0A429ZNT1_9ENTE|nr:hypothetical protein [Vagococcus bubulae]RST95370.1 hypothetical protein CBF36_03810 [Vagococcus bubulae]
MANQDNKVSKNTKGIDILAAGLNQYSELIQAEADKKEKFKAEFIESPEKFISKHEVEIYLNTLNVRTDILAILQEQLNSFQKDALEFEKYIYNSEFANKSYMTALEQVSRFTGLIQTVNTLNPVTLSDKASIVVSDVKAGTVTQIDNAFVQGGK